MVDNKFKIDLSSCLKGIQVLRDMKDVQCSDGNWDCNPYMHGMANGLIFALSILDNCEPKYLDAPDKWLDIEENTKLIEQIKGLEVRLKFSREALKQAVDDDNFWRKERNTAKQENTKLKAEVERLRGFVKEFLAWNEKMLLPVENSSRYKALERECHQQYEQLVENALKEE